MNYCNIIEKLFGALREFLAKKAPNPVDFKEKELCAQREWCKCRLQPTRWLTFQQTTCLKKLERMFKSHWFSAKTTLQWEYRYVSWVPSRFSLLCGGCTEVARLFRDSDDHLVWDVLIRDLVSQYFKQTRHDRQQQKPEDYSKSNYLWNGSPDWMTEFMYWGNVRNSVQSLSSDAEKLELNATEFFVLIFISY